MQNKKMQSKNSLLDEDNKAESQGHSPNNIVPVI